jgi:hypothetical protein
LRGFREDAEPATEFPRRPLLLLLLLLLLLGDRVNKGLGIVWSFSEKLGEHQGIKLEVMHEGKETPIAVSPTT